MSNVKFVANKSNKQALQEWEELLDSVRNSTPVDLDEDEGVKAKRIKALEAKPEEWFKYYFPKYCFAEAADFQKKSTRRVLDAKKLYQRRAWARGLSKSTRRMFEIFYKTLVQKFPTTMLLISKSYDNAERLLDSYMANFEANQRVINDYGVQEKAGKWTHGEFTTRGNCSFRAIGAEQSPRGSKNEELRVNMIVIDDMDDDEVCRNPERLQQRWEWLEKAVMPTVEISKPFFVFVDNNIIAEDCIAIRAGEKADDVEQVNIRDEFGNSVWPEKNSEADIDYMINLISYESSESEYFNNPMGQGKTFKEITWGKCPPLKLLPFVIVYADPSTSNKDKPSIKSKAQNSCKVVAILGYNESKYYLYNCYVDNTSNSNFIDWLYAARDYIANKSQPYFYIENNSLQNPFYEQVLLPLVFEKGKQKQPTLPVTPDAREKPEKWTRIEGTLEPVNRLGQLIFNIDEKENPHMKRMEAQFKSASATSKKLDGPDAVEGGVFLINSKISVAAAGGIELYKRLPNNKRF